MQLVDGAVQGRDGDEAGHDLELGSLVLWYRSQEPETGTGNQEPTANAEAVSATPTMMRSSFIFVSELEFKLFKFGANIAKFSKMCDRKQ